MNLNDENNTTFSSEELAAALDTLFEVQGKITKENSIKDCLAYLDTLARQKQTLSAYDIFLMMRIFIQNI